MTRDKGLEELLNDDLNSIPGLTQKAMFGGWVWLLDSKLLCGARKDGMLIRLGKGNEDWALKIQGIVPMISGKRRIHGWVRADPQVYANDALRTKLLKAALSFIRTVPEK